MPADKKTEWATKQDISDLRNEILGLSNELGQTKASAESAQDAVGHAQKEMDAVSRACYQNTAAIEEHKAALVHMGSVVDGHAERLEMFRRAQMYIDASMEKGFLDIKTKLDKAQQEIVAMQAMQDSLPNFSEDLIAVRAELAAAVAELRTHAEVSAQAASATEAVDNVANQMRQELEASRSSLKEDFACQLENLESRILDVCDGKLSSSHHDLKAEMETTIKNNQEALGASLEIVRTQSARQQSQNTSPEGTSTVAHDELVRVESKLKAIMAERGKAIETKLEHSEAEVHRCLGELQRLKEGQRASLEEALKAQSEAEKQLASVTQDATRRLQQMEVSIAPLKAACAEVGGIPTRQVEWNIENGLKRFKLLQEDCAEGSRSLWSPRFDAAGASGLQLELRTVGPADQVETGQEKRSGDCSLFLWAPMGLQLSFRIFIGNESVTLKHNFDGQSPCGLHRICYLSDQAEQHSGHVTAGVEIHEAGLDVNIEADVAVEVAGKLPEGSLLSKRYLNNKLLELIQTQSKGLSEYVLKKVDVMRSKAVRRVQWRLEQAFKLKEVFVEGRPVCSTAFQAAGINGMQLVFYPSGCAGAREGFCSFFLSCPAGCTLKCWLWAGRWRKEARQEVTDKTDMLGRVNFCRFENCVDPVDESVELALEIEEAQQQISGPTLPDLSQKLDSGDSTLLRSDVATMKVQANKTKNENAVKQLPSIWTSQGFQSFGDLNDSARSSPGYNASTPLTHARAKSGGGNQSSPITPQASPRKGARPPGGIVATNPKMGSGGVQRS